MHFTTLPSNIFWKICKTNYEYEQRLELLTEDFKHKYDDSIGEVIDNVEYSSDDHKEIGTCLNNSDGDHGDWSWICSNAQSSNVYNSSKV